MGTSRGDRLYVVGDSLRLAVNINFSWGLKQRKVPETHSGFNDNHHLTFS